MPRTKTYQASQARAEQALAAHRGGEDPQPIVNADAARIDMVSLLGPGARFARGRRRIDFSDWLGCGIDAWVSASGACLKAMLLSGARETTSVAGYGAALKKFFAYLTEVRQEPKAPRVATPAGLSPLHVSDFAGWLQKHGQARAWAAGSTRDVFKKVKTVLLEMFVQGFIPGEPSRFFTLAPLPWRDGDSKNTSLSDGEQQRLAQAIKSDLVAIHRSRLTLNPADIQALRLLLVAHRQGSNPTPLLELQRDALLPGFLPGTVRIRTAKHRSRKLRSGVGRAAPDEGPSGPEPAADIVFSLAEGAVLQQAIENTRDLVDEAPVWLRNRVWLYRSQRIARGFKQGPVTCLTASALNKSVKALIERHQLLGDDGQPLRLNLSRLRKSFFDRALRASDGDLAVTANLMGNTPQVASLNYASMNGVRLAEAAGFMNDDYPLSMRPGTADGDRARVSARVIEVRQFKSTAAAPSTALPTQTPVSGCTDTLNGQHAPCDGRSHCDRYVMCLFCSSFAVVGTVDELWRLFSFQSFAKAELQYLDMTLGQERAGDEALEDLRDRYRLVIPYIDEFTQRQFAASRVAQARARIEGGLHPFWQHQMTMSRRGRAGRMEAEWGPHAPREDDGTGAKVDA